MQRKCKNWLRTYMDYTRFSEAPDNFHFWTGVSTIAGALRRKVWIDMGYFQWTPNFFIVLVAKPGIAAKSTTADIGMTLLRQIDGIKFGPNASTMAAFIELLAEAKELYQMPNDEFFPMSCLTVSVSEIGTFLKPSDAEMIDVLVDLWDGKQGAYHKATKGNGKDNVENPWVNIIGCTTPAWISGNFPEYMIGGGFTSRCVFVHATEKRQFVAYPKKKLPADWHDQAANLVHDLAMIADLAGEYVLTPDAFEWGEKWYYDHYNNEQPAELNNDRFQGYLARKQTHIHKLAMILAAAERDDMKITRNDLAMAERFVTQLETEMPKIFGRIGQTVETQQASKIVDYIRAYNRIDRQELYRLVFTQYSHDEFIKAINAAISAGYARQEQHGQNLLLIAQTPKVIQAE